MTQIEQVVEGKNVLLPDYSAKKFTEAEIASGAHRAFVAGAGGTWDEGGASQLQFLKEHGLRPVHRVVDIGCGALRAGRHMVDYLDAGNYYGVDANQSLIQIGYDTELSDGQRGRLPIANLRANDRFKVDFGVQFDFAIAQSVFTHVSLNHVRLCLYRLGKVMRPGGVFFASFCEQPEDTPVDYIYQLHPNGRTYFNEKNVFWYHRGDLKWAAGFGPWQFRFVGDYGSPQKQVMVSFTRLTHEAGAARENARTRAAAKARSAQASVRAGGPKGFIVRARRRAARIISPY